MNRNIRLPKTFLFSFVFIILTIPPVFASWNAFILKAGGFSVNLSWHFTDPISEHMTASELWPLLSLFTENDPLWTSLKGRRDFRLSYSEENGLYSLIVLSGNEEERRFYGTFPELMADLIVILQSDYGFHYDRAAGFRLYKLEVPFRQDHGYLQQAPQSFNIYLGPSESGMQGLNGYILLFTSPEEALEYLRKNSDLDFTCTSRYVTQENIDRFIR